MPRELESQGLPILRLTGGLNVATSPLETPLEDAQDLSNIEIAQDGTIRKRRSFDFIGSSDQYTEVDWADGSNDPAPSMKNISFILDNGEIKNYLVIFVVDTLYMYDLSDYQNLDGSVSPVETFDISSYLTSTDAALYNSSFLEDRGRCLFVNPKCAPLLIRTDGSNNLEIVELEIRTRDLKSTVKDSYLAYGDANFLCIKDHTSSSTNEPGVGSEWEEYWERFGPKDGNADGRWATGASYVSNVEINSTSTITAAAFSSGRLWVVLNEFPSTLFFSQSVIDDFDYGRFYQVADPLNKHDSEVVDTDGGSMIINGAGNILAIQDFSAGVLVFASNGVWQISGSGGDVFRATDFNIEKISSTKIISPRAVTQVEDKIIYFGYGDAYLVDVDDITGKTLPKIITAKVRPFYTSIPIQNRERGVTVYNQSEKKVYFWTNFLGYSWNTRIKSGQSGRFRDCLVYDVVLNSWSKYSLVDDTSGDLPYISDITPVSFGGAKSSYIIASDGSYVITSSSSDVVSSSAPEGYEDYVNLCLVCKRTSTKFYFAFATNNGPFLKDFSRSDSEDEIGSYNCFYYTSFIDFDEIGHYKRAPYISFVFKQDPNSSVLMRPSFDFATGNKRGEERQIYRANKWSVGRYDGASLEEDAVIVREYVRGRGKNVQIQLTGEEGKEFHLYGIQLDVNVQAG